MSNSLPARFWERVRRSEKCWEWIGVRTHNGYGMVTIDARSELTHRLVYESLVGPIPEGLEIDHLCRMRACVRPTHLEAVTHEENMQRGYWGQLTHCKYGHPFNEANTHYRKVGGRTCLTCNRAARRRYIAKRGY